ncbi:MAG: asparagine synthase (glutamine-hydrolyzing) [Acidobacteria bacterium]|nr:asparagine synthase (glutamine-hydrolyzing) [Acidobacteriota bacterium]
MCGIAGVVGLRDGLDPPTLDELTRMAGALRHRGPDEFGVYRDRHAGLAHARLSIIDLATGQQPLANEDDTWWIAFNGEIFNYLELRDDLVARGHRFRTRSDTEVIVHAYEEWRDEAFRRFNGQWAVALWNAARRTLVLARDPYGVRPLYCCEHRGRLYFASEVKAIFAADPTVPRALDPIGLEQVFTFWAPLAPRTVFSGVTELEPAAVLTLSPSGLTKRWAWEPTYPAAIDDEFRGSREEAVDAVRDALEQATALRMLRADVPVGSYLSGGLDSSLVAALGLRAKGDRFSTFSLRFEDAEYDETAYQRLMAAHLGSDHHEVLVSRRDIAQVFPDVVYHAERPMLRTAPAPLFLLSKLVHDAGIKVVLTGEGADEMFAGYDLFREGKVRRFWARQPASTWRPALLERLYPYLQRSPVAQRAVARQFFGRDLGASGMPGFAHGTRWHTTGALKRLLGPDMRAAVGARDVVADFLATLPPEFGQWSALAQDQFVEIRTLLSGYLLSAQGDRMLMAHSVEGRFPFLDRNVARLADSLPPAYKLRVLDEKHVLKRASAGLVPAEILDRKKQPYRAPDALSFTGADRPAWVDEVVSERAVAEAGVFDPRQVGQLWQKCLARAGSGQFSNADNMALVGVLSTQLLHHHLIRAEQAPPPVPLRTLVDAIS